jgi:hypothetical protein
MSASGHKESLKNKTGSTGTALPAPFHSLKVVVTRRAVESAGFEAASLKNASRNHTGKGRFDQAFR